jgi:type II secretory pathway pseudopilin PulG
MSEGIRMAEDDKRRGFAAGVRARCAEDRGATLVELLVYLIIMVILVALIATTFVKGRGVQGDQQSLADASNEAQLAAASIERPIRNAASIQVDSSVIDGGGKLLVVKTRVGEPNSSPASWRCEAWFYDSVTRTIYQTSATPGPAAETAGLTAPPDVTTWRPLISDVDPVKDQPVFRTTGIGGGITMQFEAASQRKDTPVRINSTVIPRMQGAGIGTESCGEYL